MDSHSLNFKNAHRAVGLYRQEMSDNIIYCNIPNSGLRSIIYIYADSQCSVTDKTIYIAKLYREISNIKYKRTSNINT